MTEISNDPQTSNDKSTSLGLNSVQLNVVTFVDVQRANATKSVYDNVFMADNGVHSSGRGTPHLQTNCKPGQTINWVIYPIDSTKRPDGTWPPSVKINNIVFLDGDGTNVYSEIVCNELKIYGGPDKMRSPYTPVFYYWAGMVETDLEEGIYKYRLILELDTEDPSKKNYLNLDTPSLNLVSLL